MIDSRIRKITSSKLNRRSVLRLTAAGSGLVVASRYFTGSVAAQIPPLEEKDTYTIGFAQTGLNNPWRLGESKSMQDEAARLGYTLVETNANEDTAKQIADVASLIAQGVDILIFPPRESQALAPSVLEAKNAGIPVILIDRDVDHSIARPGEDYITFIGSDFVDQGRRAAEWLVEATGGEAKIIQLEGTTGADPAIDRQKGFEDYLAGTFQGTPTPEGAHPGMEIIASQTADFQRDPGREVMQTLLQAHPDVTAVYAHNDEMAIGAIAALQEAGRTPGEDVILVSIDGSNAALDAIVDGTLGASVESSPFFGPIAFETMQQYIAGEDIPDWVKVEDRFFDESNAAEFQGKQF
ncbi:MAG: putative Ribose/xylose/arabinose/galactoside type transport system, periplasmic component [Thermomicrobiales bacterium]|nr:putative Ribose/xylose/arabinose/galactoside type transport system, periplasmic component [Thermomicrobiales bacterium]MDF3042998.1 putative Ribose/xylose/arabinose/galactoside type transport system, periplasmic component [Thermomicrobiales bacterium]